nr:TonB-dependent receptor [Deltaproteobacteria bacterium]
GSSLPSPEPEKRVVPLDLFPTSLLEAVVIQKTFSPDRPAEFGGGIVEIRTRGIPEEPVLSLSLTGTYSAGTTLRLADFGETGRTDWIGLGKDHRALAPALAEAAEETAIKPGGIFSDDGYDADELEAFGEMVTPRWGLTERQLPPDFGAAVTTGGKVTFGDVEVGGLAGAVFSNAWSVDEGFRSIYSVGEGDVLQEKRRTTFTETQNRIRSGGALSVGASYDDRVSVTSTTLLMRSSTGSALTYLADDVTGSSDTQTTRIGWEEQQLLFEQVVAHVDLDRVVIDGRYATAIALRDEPDRREYTRDVTDSGLSLAQSASWNEIFYTTLEDRTREVGLDVSVPVREDGRIAAGGVSVRRQRTSDTRRFTFNFQGSEGIDLFDPIEDVMTPENIGEEGDDDPGYLELAENTTSSDDYSASQRLDAAYLLADVPWTDRFGTLVGARVERSNQTVSTFQLFDTSLTPVVAELQTTDVLPAATMTFGIGRKESPDDMLIRAGYGRTVSRPEFRELTSVAYYDYRSGRLLFGNPDLERATIDNVDLRWEWYPRAGETVSAGLFFKYFQDPIESIVAVSAVSGSVGTFANATSATNLGTEIDVRRNVISDFWLTANTSFIASRVDLSESGGNGTTEKRPLQGQSPWVVNAQLSYENPDERRNAALLYNVFGPRIVEVGTSGIPDTYEMPVHRVDLVMSQGFGPHWQLRAKGTNLLDWPVRQRTGGEIAEEARSGWTAGLTLTWSPVN